MKKRAIFIIFCLLSIQIVAVQADNSTARNMDNEPEDSDSLDEEFLDEEFLDEPGNDEIYDPQMVVTISRIKFIVSKKISKEWVKSLLLFKENTQVSLMKLEKLIDKTQRKLVNMNFFYSVNIYTLPPVSDPAGRIVVVELSDGFWYGFNFWPWSFSLSYKNLFKANKQITGTLGLDTQEVKYHDPSFLFSDFSYTALLSHITVPLNNQYLIDRTRVYFQPNYTLLNLFNMGATVNLQWFNFPDTYFLYPELQKTLAENEMVENGINAYKLFLNGGLYLQFDYFKPYKSKYWGFLASIYPQYYYSITEPENSYWGIDFIVKTRFQPLTNLLFMIKNYEGYHSRDTYPFLKYALTEHFRGIANQSLCDYYSSTNFDIITDLFQIPLGILSLDFKLFAFFDMARGFAVSETFSFDTPEIAGGGGLHVYFSTPVDMYITLGGSLNREARFKFLFEISSAPY